METLEELLMGYIEEFDRSPFVCVVVAMVVGTTIRLPPPQAHMKICSTKQSLSVKPRTALLYAGETRTPRASRIS